jgi:hypothetical protein
VIAKNVTALPGSITSIEAMRLRPRNALTRSVMLSGTRWRSNLQVASATAMRTPKTRSEGAGSTRTAARRKTPSTTAAS